MLMSLLRLAYPLFRKELEEQIIAVGLKRMAGSEVSILQFCRGPVVKLRPMVEEPEDFI